MNIDDLWIGDDVLIKATGIKGTFQGKGKNNQYLIKTGDGKLLLVNANDIDHEASRTSSAAHLKKDESSSQYKSKRLANLLDLDDEALKKEYPSTHKDMLDYQLETCEEFLRSNKAKKETYCKIIFGEHTKLKSAIAALLRKHPEISIYTPHPDQDAWEVWFDYGDEEE